MTFTFPQISLERLLLALESELLEAPEEEMLAAAAELGINPAIKGSAAFFGVTVPLRSWRRVEGFHEPLLADRGPTKRPRRFPA